MLKDKTLRQIALSVNNSQTSLIISTYILIVVLIGYVASYISNVTLRLIEFWESASKDANLSLNTFAATPTMNNESSYRQFPLILPYQQFAATPIPFQCYRMGLLAIITTVKLRLNALLIVDTV